MFVFYKGQKMTHKFVEICQNSKKTLDREWPRFGFYAAFWELSSSNFHRAFDVSGMQIFPWLLIQDGGCK